MITLEEYIAGFITFSMVFSAVLFVLSLRFYILEHKKRVAE